MGEASMAKGLNNGPDPIDWSTVVPIAELQGDDEEDTELLVKNYSEARSFLLSHDWCRAISSAYFGMGVGGIFSVFLFQVEGECDDWLWVVEGDLPSAYFVIDEAPNPTSALAVYVKLMREWVAAVRGQSKIEDAYPIRAAPTEENARKLETRLDYLELEFLKRAE